MNRENQERNKRDGAVRRPAEQNVKKGERQRPTGQNVKKGERQRPAGQNVKKEGQRPAGQNVKKGEGQRPAEQRLKNEERRRPQQNGQKKDPVRKGEQRQGSSKGKKMQNQNMNKKKKNKNNKKGSSIFLNITLVIALLVFVVSGVQLVRSLLPYFQGGAEYDDIKELAVVEEDSKESGKYHFQVDFDRLKEINPDTIAWIRFEEPSVISYPVVQGTDNSKYLKATFRANDNKLGAIFADYESAPDFTDRNTFIYGHNLKVGGEMFSQLLEYQSEDFYKAHPYFYIYTPDGKTRTYQIFSAGVVKDTADNYQKEFASDEEFLQYLQLAKSSSAYNTGVEVTKDSLLVSLSTCTNVREDERFLVQGVLIKEETAEE